MANIFELHKYQTFGLLEMHRAKSDLTIINSICENVWFAIKRLSKMLFFNFWLLHSSKFLMTFVKNLKEKPSFL